MAGHLLHNSATAAIGVDDPGNRAVMIVINNPRQLECFVSKTPNLYPNYRGLRGQIALTLSVELIVVVVWSDILIQSSITGHQNAGRNR